VALHALGDDLELSVYRANDVHDLIMRHAAAIRQALETPVV